MGPPSPRARRGRRLATIDHVRAALAHVLREVELDRMDVRKARVMIYGLSVLAGVIQGTDLERRLAALEERAP